MGFLDRLLGREDRSQQQAPAWGQPQQQPPQGYRYGQQSYDAGPVAAAPGAGGARTEDEQAVERYRYLLKTAPPERIEEVHAEAFERLTPEQRRMVYEEFTRTAPEGEAPRGNDPRSLAQAATRSEIRQPGYMERSLGGMNGGGRGMGGGMGGGFGQRQGTSFGGMLGASILGSVAGYVIASSLMSAFQPDAGSFDGGTDASGADGSGDAGDGGSGDTGAENASYDDGGGSDFGGGDGFDDFGGDMGGGFDI